MAYLIDDIRWETILESDQESSALTKLICTLGPSTQSTETLKALLDAGMSVARFDFTWGTQEYHQQTFDNLRTASSHTRRLVATMLDTKGPEIEVLSNKNDISLRAGDSVIVTGDASQSSSDTCIVISLDNVHQLVDVGRQIFIGQYLFTGAETTSVYLTVQRIEGTNVLCSVHNQCKLDGEQLLTVHISNLRNPKPILSQGDIAALRDWVPKNGIDYVSVSFTRNAEDIASVRQLLDSVGASGAGIISKIESLEGLLNYKDIIAASDGVVISRGNLGIDLPAEKVFMAQKLLLHEANLQGKPAIVTRVVDSMTNAPRPTRAEATDIANLVLDGADSVMLGAETMRGLYPVDAARTVLAIARRAEAHFDSAEFYKQLLEVMGGFRTDEPMDRDEAVASAAVRGAAKIDAKVILCFTQSGRTPRLVAKYKAPVPIVTMFVPKLRHDGIKWNWSGETQARQALLIRGCVPVLIDPARPSHIEGAMLANAVAKAMSMELCRLGDRMVVIQCPRRGGTESALIKNVTVGAHNAPDSLKVGSVTDILQSSANGEGGHEDDY